MNFFYVSTLVIFTFTLIFPYMVTGAIIPCSTDKPVTLDNNSIKHLQCAMLPGNSSQYFTIWLSPISNNNDNNTIIINTTQLGLSTTIPDIVLNCSISNKSNHSSILKICSYYIVYIEEIVITLNPNISFQIDDRFNYNVTCTSSGYPTPTVYWNNNTNAGSDLHVLQLGMLGLMVNGTYEFTCISSNMYQNVSRSINVTILTQTILRLMLLNQFHPLLDNITLFCNVTSIFYDKFLIEWYHNSTLLPSYGQELQLINVNTSNSGHYQCRAILNSTSIVSNSEFLQIFDPPKILINSSNFIYEINTMDFIMCETIGSPTPNVRWIYPDSTVISNSTLNLSTLTSSNDTGNYTCVANIYNLDIDSRTIFISVIPPPPSIIISVTSLGEFNSFNKSEIFVNDSLNITCQASSSILDSTTGIFAYSWTRDSSEISTNKSLILPNIDVIDEGVYDCRVILDNSRPTNKSINIIVNIKPQIISNTSADICYRLSEINSTSFVECLAIGKPEPSVSWTYMNHPCYFPKCSDGILNVSQLTVKDSGKYICIAMNSNGMDSRRYDISIIPPLPHVMISPDDRFKLGNINFTVNCTINYADSIQISLFLIKNSSRAMTVDLYLNNTQTQYSYPFNVTTYTVANYSCEIQVETCLDIFEIVNSSTIIYEAIIDTLPSSTYTSTSTATNITSLNSTTSTSSIYPSTTQTATTQLTLQPSSSGQLIIIIVPICLIILAAIIIVVLVLCFIYCFYYYKFKLPKISLDNTPYHQSLAYTGIYEGEMENFYHPEVSYLIPIKQYEQAVDKLYDNNDALLRDQYNALPQLNMPSEEGKKSNNTSKNRYPDILAYDHSRVIISKSQSSTDYINANFIDGYQIRNAYIASQGPLGPSKYVTETTSHNLPQSNTVNDFWKMIWEHDISNIVMLTNLVENNRSKCALYWPENKNTYGRICVETIDSQIFSDYIISHFIIKRITPSKSNQSVLKELTHFHFTAWPDHGVPDFPTAMLQFVKLVRNHLNKTEHHSPLLVHCSAGVGRTGTFICLDILLQHLASGADSIDIWQEGAKLRKKRNYMIQEMSQYKFVYEVIREHIAFGNTECSSVDFSKLFNGLLEVTAENPYEIEASYLALEFKKLRLKVITTQHKEANRTENSNKNRFVMILPFDNNRVILNPLPATLGSDYINASYIDSWRSNMGFIATQGPLKNTIEDFWRMIIFKKCSIIVMLCEISEDKCEDYFSTRLNFGHYQIQTTRKYIQNNYIHREILVRSTGSIEPYVVNHFQFTQLFSSESVIKECAKGLLSLITGVRILKTSGDINIDNPIVVHCSGGNGLTGAFIGVCNVIERLDYEDKIDVFNVVKRLRLQRVGMVQSVDQYELCYRTILEFLQGSNI